MLRRHAPIHVLMLTDSLGVGGAEQLVVRVAAALDPERFRRSVCLTRPLVATDPRNQYGTRENVEWLRARGVELLELRRRSGRDFGAWRPLFAFLRQEHVAVLHAHKFGSNLWGSVVGTLRRVPLVLAHEHSWAFEGQPLRQLLDRAVIARLADAVIAVSEEDRRKMSTLVGIPHEKIVVVPNGIPPLLPGDRPGTRAALGVADGVPLLVTLANLRPEKALDVMIRALAIVRAEVPQTRLLIAGGGNRTPLLDLARSLGVADAVLFSGLRRDVENLLAASDVALLSSDREGSPLSVMEYLAAGLPVVATSVGGVPELVRDRENGLLVPRRDPQAMAAAVVELLHDPDRRRRMGDRGRRLQQERFSLDAMTRRLSRLYEERLATRSEHRHIS